MAAAIRRDEAKLAAANAADVAAAKAAGHDAAFVDRLTLTPKTIAAMAEGLEQIAALADPVGRDLRSPVPPVRHPGRHDAPCRWASSASSTSHGPNVTGRRRGPVPQGRQRHDPARGSEALRSKPGDRRLRARGPARGGTARDRRPDRRDDRPRGGQPISSRWTGSST